MAARHVDWTTLLVVAGIGLGILLGPFQLLRLAQRMWEQRRREQPPPGSDPAQGRDRDTHDDTGE